jgi:ankyrin repeat protein
MTTALYIIMTSPLYYAIEQSHCDAAKLLVANGADVNMWVDIDCPNPEESGYGLRSRRCDHPVSLLHVAVCSNDPYIVELLLLNGADQGSECDEGSCVHIAICKGNADIVRLLYYYNIDIGKEYNIPYRDCYKCSTSWREDHIGDIELALDCDNTDVIAIIASYQTQSIRDDMLIDAYNKNNSLDTIKKLIDMGADRSIIRKSIENKYKYYKSLYDLME